MEVGVWSTLIQARLFSEGSPADGMSAAAEGTSARPAGSSVVRVHKLCEPVEYLCRELLQCVGTVVRSDLIGSSPNVPPLWGTNLFPAELW